jgi:hypothetical protein
MDQFTEKMYLTRYAEQAANALQREVTLMAELEQVKKDKSGLEARLAAISSEGDASVGEA